MQNWKEFSAYCNFVPSLLLSPDSQPNWTQSNVCIYFRSQVRFSWLCNRSHLGRTFHIAPVHLQVTTSNPYMLKTLHSKAPCTIKFKGHHQWHIYLFLPIFGWGRLHPTHRVVPTMFWKLLHPWMVSRLSISKADDLACTLHKKKESQVGLKWNRKWPKYEYSNALFVLSRMS